MESWEWRYGKTPKFNITVESNKQSVIATVKNGIIENVSSTCSGNFNNFVGKKFNMNIVDDIKQCSKTIEM